MLEDCVCRPLGSFVKPPRVTVICTCYNYAAYIADSIDSIISQTYSLFECLVIDDCSDDDSFEIVTKKLDALNDQRFRCIRLGQNLGQMGAIKAGLENSLGDFVAIVDADDKLLPTFLEEHLNAHLNGSFSAALTASDTLQIDEDDRLLESTLHSVLKHRSDSPEQSVRAILPSAVAKITDNEIYLSAPAASPVFRVDSKFTGWPYSAMSSFMFRRSVLEIIMPSNTEPFRICADYYLARFAHTISGSLIIWRQLSCFRLHGKNNFSNNSVLGGYYRPGDFKKRHIAQTERAIALHIISNLKLFSQLMGIDSCVSVIRAMIPRKARYKAVKDHPVLVRAFGRGSVLRFKLKYGLLYRHRLLYRLYRLLYRLPKKRR